MILKHNRPQTTDELTLRYMQCPSYDPLFHGMSMKLKNHVWFCNVEHVSPCSTLYASYVCTLSICGQHPVQWVPGLYRRGQSGQGVEHTRPCSTEVKNEWSCNSTPLYAFTAWAGTNLPLFCPLQCTRSNSWNLFHVTCLLCCALLLPRYAARLWGRNSMFIH
jgi:hypothetical protein